MPGRVAPPQLSRRRGLRRGGERIDNVRLPLFIVPMSQPVAAPETLLSADKIASRIRELGAQITQDYAGRELVLVCVLKGSFVFAADLARAIDLPVRIEFFGVKSYGAQTHSSDAWYNVAPLADAWALAAERRYCAPACRLGTAPQDWLCHPGVYR